MDTSPSASTADASNFWPPAIAIWHGWADTLSEELGTDVTWTPAGFLIHGYIASSPAAVRAIAGVA